MKHNAGEPCALKDASTVRGRGCRKRTRNGTSLASYSTEVLLASFNNGRVTEATITRFRQRLQEAQEAGIWDIEMRPVRNVLSRTRLKTRAFGIEISSILETGYILMYMPNCKQWDI